MRCRSGPSQRLMSRFFPAACLAVVVQLLATVCGQAFAASNTYSASIRLSVDRWLSAQKPSGFFPYGYDFLADEELEPKGMSIYNLTRQAGAASVLADYYRSTGDERVPPVLQRLITAFGRYSLPIGKSRMESLVEKTHLLSIPIGRFKIRAALERLGLLYEKEGPGKVLAPASDYSKAATNA